MELWGYGGGNPVGVSPRVLTWHTTVNTARTTADAATKLEERLHGISCRKMFVTYGYAIERVGCKHYLGMFQFDHKSSSKFRNNVVVHCIERYT